MQRRIMMLFAVFLVFVTAISSQELKHAPTTEQCRADQRLWLSKLEQVNPPDPVARVGYAELMAWEREMLDCRHVDPERRDLYHNTAAEIDAERADRLATFLFRHGLMDQFYAEEAQGKQ